jgi:hypothetical protein
MSAFNMDGKVVAAGDSVSVVGTIGTPSGNGPTATVTFTSVLNDSLVGIKTQNLLAPVPTSQTPPVAEGNDGEGLAAGQAVLLGYVTGVSGNQLTITLPDGTSQTVTSTACHSTSQK